MSHAVRYENLCSPCQRAVRLWNASESWRVPGLTPPEACKRCVTSDKARRFHEDNEITTLERDWRAGRLR